MVQKDELIPEHFPARISVMMQDTWTGIRLEEDLYLKDALLANKQ